MYCSIYWLPACISIYWLFGFDCKLLVVETVTVCGGMLGVL